MTCRPWPSRTVPGRRLSARIVPRIVPCPMLAPVPGGCHTAAGGCVLTLVTYKENAMPPLAVTRSGTGAPHVRLTRPPAAPGIAPARPAAPAYSDRNAPRLRPRPDGRRPRRRRRAYHPDSHPGRCPRRPGNQDAELTSCDESLQWVKHEPLMSRSGAAADGRRSRGPGREAASRIPARAAERAAGGVLPAGGGALHRTGGGGGVAGPVGASRARHPAAGPVHPGRRAPGADGRAHPADADAVAGPAPGLGRGRYGRPG